MTYDFTLFIENDNNPFILFDVDGKIYYLNTSAEFLLGKANKQDIYELCLAYAPKEYGSRMTHIDLKYDDLAFYGITVAYQDDSYIGIRLYQRIKNRQLSAKEISKYVLTDINRLLETSISLLNIKNRHEIKLIMDPDIPEFKISQNDFLKIMRKCFETFDNNAKINIMLKLKVGEMVVVKDERCKLVKLEIKSSKRDKNNDLDIEKLCEHVYIDFLADHEKIRLIIPVIQ